MEVVWSEQSRDYLLHIYTFIFKQSPQNALRVFETLLKLGDSLANDTAEYSKDLIINDDSIRFITKWNYKIVYERTTEKVINLDVFGTKQNPEKLLHIFKK